MWDGAVWVFSALEDYQSCPNHSMIATSTPSGVNDALWWVQLSILIIISKIFVAFFNTNFMMLRFFSCWVQSFNRQLSHECWNVD